MLRTVDTATFFLVSKPRKAWISKENHGLRLNGTGQRQSIARVIAAAAGACHRFAAPPGRLTKLTNTHPPKQRVASAGPGSSKNGMFPAYKRAREAGFLAEYKKYS